MTAVSALRSLLRRYRRKLQNVRADAARRRILGTRFRLLVVCGQKRSGNHLFLAWYAAQRRGPCLHYNHVRPDQPPTERERRTFHSGGGDGLPTLILSYEDHPLEAVFGGPLAAFLIAQGDRIAERHLVLVGRDPRNLPASRFRKWPHERDDPAAREAVLARLTEYAAPLLDAPDTLHGMRFTPVLYDALIAARPYRDRLSDRLGIARGDAGLDAVPAYGHGSSFDGVARQAEAMEVRDRWRAFADDPVFRDALAGPPLDDLLPRFDAAIAAGTGASG
jgi:hypothetical protein